MKRSVLPVLFLSGIAVLGAACQLPPEIAAFNQADTPLTAAVSTAESHVNGTALEASFEREYGVSVYSVVVVDAQDTFWEVYVDAGDGSVVGANQAQDERDRLPPGPVTLQQAIAAAESHQGGRGMEAEFDEYLFEDAFSVTIVRDDRVYDLYISTDDARVLRAREDRDERRDSVLD